MLDVNLVLILGHFGFLDLTNRYCADFCPLSFEQRNHGSIGTHHQACWCRLRFPVLRIRLGLRRLHCLGERSGLFSLSACCRFAHLDTQQTLHHLGCSLKWHPTRQMRYLFEAFEALSYCLLAVLIPHRGGKSPVPQFGQVP
jgi:hypothetical protein